ncbi:MAG: DNA polymerase/3'-5' exonuclease PolX [Actinomycetota bacterium]|nr:DNA polymerase/3'-5' exonuclease PolX [Actinomycetota bacterium]
MKAKRRKKAPQIQEVKIEISNEEVARILEDIGDMLGIVGESSFRVRAYYKAASSIRGLTRPLLEIYKEGGVKGLEEIPGVGSHTAQRLEELITTGRLGYYEELKKKVPAPLTELMDIPGIGPKKAKKIYDTLGITTRSELIKAIEEHKVSRIPGFGLKTEENILRGIRQYEKMHERILLSDAFPIAKEIVELLRKQPFVERADMAGSLRRMKETVGDIDLLASSDEPSKVMDYFTTMPQVSYVLAKGDTKSSIVARNGLQIDLRVVATYQYGAALQYFTGSKPHNVHLRDLAKKRGLKINEYGVFDASTDERLGGKTEEEIYGILGMQTPPPTLREDKGEIEMAIEHRLPILVQLGDIKGDFHVHTKWSDGFNDIEDVVKVAIGLGYKFATISDHAEKLHVAGGLTPEELDEQLQVIAELNERYQEIEILTGIEANIDNDGNVDFGPDILSKLDVVIGSIHGGFRQSKEQLTKRLLAAIENPYINVIGHPTGRVLGERPPYDIDLPAIFKAAASTGTFLELNAFPNRLDLKDDHLRDAKENYGCKFVINTDAHIAAHMVYMEYGVATAQRGWLTREDILNTYEVSEIKKMLRQKR